MATNLTPSKKRLALAIIDFLSTSVTDGTLSSEDAESIEVATSCIADSFKVDPSDATAKADALGGQNLLSIYGVYEKLKGKSTASTTGASSAAEARPSTPQTSTSKPASTGPTDAQRKEAEVLKSAGNAAMAAKDYPTAITQYSAALELVPGNAIYLSNRAAAYSASGDHAAASQDAEMAVASDPKYTKAWSRLGLARFAQGDAAGAVEAYERGIEAEGNGGSEAMRRGLETARRRVDEEARTSSPTPASPRGGGAGGGMPDLSSLASMLGGGAGGAGGAGGGGMPDLASLMNNPMFASMAQNLMSNPDMLNNIMSNPRLREMAERFGGGGGGGAGGAGGGMPDMSQLMQDPSIAEMARNLMGSGAGRGRGGQQQ